MLLSSVVSAEGRARRVGRIFLVVDLCVALWVAGAVALAVRDAPAKRYVRAGAMLSTTLVDESTLARDVGKVVATHANAVNEAVGPRWPTLAKRTLAANESMERGAHRHVGKQINHVFDERGETLKTRIGDELATVVPGPVLTPARLDLLSSESKTVLRELLRDGSSHHARRSRRALELLVRELPARASDRWTEHWTRDAGQGLEEVGRRFVVEHGGLEDAQWSVEAEP